MNVKISEPPKYTQVHIGDTLTGGRKQYKVVALKYPYWVRTERTIHRRDTLTRQEETIVLTEYFRYSDINKDLSLKVKTGKGREDVA